MKLRSIKITVAHALMLVGLAISGSNRTGAAASSQAASEAEDQYNLAVRYSKGDGVPVDPRQASACYQKAAEGGLAKAQAALGYCYAKGNGVPQDYVQAAKWFRKAAEQGDPKGEYKMGIAFLRGNGVPKDSVQAVEWLRKAAGQSNALAQCVLGIEYFEGSTVPLDYGEAYKWVNLGLSQAKAGDFLRCTSIIPPPVNPPRVQINGVDLSPGEHASVRTPFGIAVIKCIAVGKQNTEILVDGEDESRTLGKSGPEDARSRLMQRAREVRARVEYRGSVGAALPISKPGPASPGATKILPPLIIRGPSNQTRSPAPPPSPAVLTPSNFAVGTGFFVTDDGYLVTCEHVVRGATSFRIRSPAGTITAKLVKKDQTIDLAVLKVNGVFRALPVAPQPRVRLGDGVFTIGFPNPDLQGVEPKLTRGEISSMAGVRDNPGYFQISVPVQPGNSGGALVDECGNVVGVVNARLDDVAAFKSSGAFPQNVNYAVKGGLLWKFLKTVPELSTKFKAQSKVRDREAASDAAERAAVLVIAESQGSSNLDGQSANEESRAPGQEVYTVRSGDSLIKIATQFGATVRAIRAENNLATDRISVGQQLRIPTTGKTF
jgi:S1-C subfamily serine protease